MFCAIAVADRRRSSTSSSPLPSPPHETPFTLTVQMLPNEVRLSSKNGKPSSPIIKLASKSDDLQEETDGRGRLVVQSRLKESMQAWTDGLVRQLHRKKLEVCHACFSGLPYMGSDHLICFNEPSRPWLISSFACPEVAPVKHAPILFRPSENVRRVTLPSTSAMDSHAIFDRSHVFSLFRDKTQTPCIPGQSSI